MPLCFKCRKQVSSVRELCHHLRHIHLLYEPSPISCAEGGCCRTFCRYNSFYRHLSTCHSRPYEELSMSVPVTEMTETSMSVSIERPATHLVADSSVVDSNVVSNKTIQDHAAHFLLTLSSSSSMTLSQLNFIKDSVSELVSNTVSIAKQSTVQLLRHHSVSDSDEKAVECFDTFGKLSNPFAGLDSKYKLEKYAAKLPSYTEPKQHVLGQHWEGSTSRQQQCLKDDTFTYVSVKETVRNILQWHGSWQEMLDLDNESTDSGVISSYFSGENFKKVYDQLKNDIKVPFYPIVLQVYYDDFETCNPIGTSWCAQIGGVLFYNIKFRSKTQLKAGQY